MTQSLQDSSIAVAHGNYVGRGGGERVAEAIARTFNAPIYYGFGDEENEPDDIECYSLFNEVLGSTVIQDSSTLRDLYYLYGWRSVPELLEYDVVIQSGNEPGWYKAPEDQTIVKYTHSPPRNAYDRYPYRAPESGLLYEGYTFATEQLYETVTSYPELYLANSEVVERRIDKSWDKNGDDVRVVYPPIETEQLGSNHADSTPIDEPYYLVLDRLEPPKHVDEIIAAFRDRDDRLAIAGTGSEESALKQQAADLRNVTFRGYVSEAEKRSLLAGAEALCYAAEDEDFGIVPIEALASGTPVIGPREGFTQHQIADTQTGILYERGGLSDALDRFQSTGVSATSDALEAVAEQYSVSRFRRELRKAVADALERTRIDSDVSQPPMPEPDTVAEPAMTDGGAQHE